jgi:methyltransferase family protein
MQNNVRRSDYHPFMAWFGGLLLSQEWNKAHLINHLAEVHGYRHYLELCTFTTGRRYAEIDRSQLQTCVRLMYRCPDDFDDGLPTDYRSNTLDIGESLKKISDEGRRFDIALVDSWHEYETSWRDLVEGFRLIREGGTLVVHDCLPPRSEIAVPKYIPGEWCGVSYQAYVDFISERHDLAVYTVDTDYGCGVIRKLTEPSPESATSSGAGLLGEWRSKRDDPMEAFAFFQAHKRVLLNLITTDEFFARERS